MEEAKGKVPLKAFRDCLVDLSQPMAKRTHAAFYLRTAGTLEAVEALVEALKNKQDSALLRHELAYILGQIQSPAACGALNQVSQSSQSARSYVDQIRSYCVWHARS